MFEKPISQSLRAATMVKIYSAASSLASNIWGFSYEQVYVHKSGWWIFWHVTWCLFLQISHYRFYWLLL
jgi:hypothetical protein